MYWPQSRPFTSSGALRQSSQRGNIVDKIAEFRHQYGIGDHVTLDRARAQRPVQLAELETDVSATVMRYPIPLLQKLGSGGRAIEQRFVYDYAWTDGVPITTIRRATFDDRLRLVDNAGSHLVALAGLLRPLIQREWLEFVARRNDADVEELRLQQFLFGSDRIGLRRLVAPLVEFQDGVCFYCQRPARGAWDVDHFLPWSRWPDNTLDNLVLAHAPCNSDKRAALAGLDHVARWWQRFDSHSPVAAGLDRVAAATDRSRRPHATQGAARALYLGQPHGTMLWVARPGEVEPLDRRRLLAIMATITLGIASDQRGTHEV